MIKINLLPYRRKKKPKPVPAFLIIGVFLMLTAVIASFYVNYIFKSRAADLEGQKDSKAKEMVALDEKIKEVNNFEALNKTFTERKNIIEQLTQTQGLPVKILDEISTRLTDGIWLVSMDIAGSSINMSGIGFSNSDIVSFVQNLKNSPLFQEVNLTGTQQSAQDNIDVYTFNLTLQIKA